MQPVRKQLQCRAVLVSGHLALQGVAPMELTTRILASRYVPGCGAQDLVDFGYMQYYYPGFVDEIREKDEVPSLNELRDGRYDYGTLCWPGGLRAADDKTWWKTSARERPLDANRIVRAVEAAGCMIRAPPLVWRSERPSDQEPQPVSAMVEILGALKVVGKELQDVVKHTEEDISRRRGRLVYDFSRMHDQTSLTDAERDLLILYERSSQASEDVRIKK